MCVSVCVCVCECVCQSNLYINQCEMVLWYVAVGNGAIIRLDKKKIVR